MALHIRVLLINIHFSVYRAWAFSPDLGLILAGGFSKEAGLLDAAEVSEDFGVSFSALPALPRAVEGSCLVVVDDRAIIIGGFDGNLRYLTGQKYCIKIALGRFRLLGIESRLFLANFELRFMKKNRLRMASFIRASSLRPRRTPTHPRR